MEGIDTARSRVQAFLAEWRRRPGIDPVRIHTLGVADCGLLDLRADDLTALIDAIDAAEAEVARLTEALHFYADEGTHFGRIKHDPESGVYWTDLVPIDKDRGEIARAALGRTP